MLDLCAGPAAQLDALHLPKLALLDISGNSFSGRSSAFLTTGHKTTPGLPVSHCFASLPSPNMKTRLDPAGGLPLLTSFPSLRGLNMAQNNLTGDCCC